MKRFLSLRFLFAAVGLIVLAMSGGRVQAADLPPQPPDAGAFPLQPGAPHFALPALPPATGNAGGQAQVRVLVELEGPPAAEVYAQVLAKRRAAAGESGFAGAAAIDGALRAELAAATQAAVAENAAAQAALAAALEPLGATVLFQAQRVHNGVAVRIDAGRLDEVRALPGVRGVRPLTVKYPGNARSVPFLGAPAAWGGTPGVTGAGVRIAIIDTGVDYLHRTFGGPGEGYEANNSTVVGDVPGFPSAKVVGGYDFAGDFYNAAAGAEGGAASGAASDVGFPDPDPMDCYGHGTHVGGTAAGYGVTASGETYSGPYNDAIGWQGFVVGPGVAPGALIYAVRVFGCWGGSDIVDLGIEYAVDPNQDGDLGDHVDVINMSLGNVLGTEEDTTAVAAERAAQVGVIVVASAGNYGDAYAIAGSPAVATSAIAVAASGHLPPGFDSYSQGPDTLASFTSRGLRRGDALLKPDISAPGSQIGSADLGSGAGSISASGTSMAAPHIAGLMALLRQLHPAWSVEELKALAMNTATATVRPTESYTTALGAPSRVGVGRADAGAAARVATVIYDLERRGAVSVSFGAPDVAGTYEAEHRVRIVNKGSTPAAYTVTYLPISDVPGVEFSAGIGPQVTLGAGAATTFPVRLSATASAMRNAPDPAVDPAETPERFFRSEEAGLLLFWPPEMRFSARLLAGNETGPAVDSTASAEVAAHFDPLTGVLSYTATLKSALTSPVREFVIGWGHAGVAAWTTQPLPGGAELALNTLVRGQITLGAQDALLLAGGQMFVQIRTQNYEEGEARGQLTASAPVLRLALHATPAAVSTLDAVQNRLDFSAAQPNEVLTRTLTLTGEGLSGSDTPTETQSLLGLFELVARSPNINPRLSGESGPDRWDMADLRFIGVTSDYAHTGAISETTVSFALAAWAPWTTPTEVQYVIGIVDGDKEAITRAIVSTYGSVQNGYMNLDDAFRVAVFKPEVFDTPSFPLNGLSPRRRHTRVFDSSVMVLSVPAGELGLSEEKASIDFYVLSTSRISGDIIEETPVFSYDVKRPGLITPRAIPGSALFPAQAGEYAVGMDVVNYIANRSRGLLALHMHNGAEAQAEVIDLTYVWPYQSWLPVVAQQKQ